jgi:hypothetical protein
MLRASGRTGPDEDGGGGLGLIVELGQEGDDRHAQGTGQSADELGRRLASTALDIGKVGLTDPGPAGEG